MEAWYRIYGGALMRALLYSADGVYFARLGGGAVMAWRRVGEGWSKGQAELPDNAAKIDFETLPQELREEVLAVLARAEAVRGPMGGASN